MAITQKISDFALCKRLLENICNDHECGFVDLDVNFCESNVHDFKNNQIIIPEDAKLQKTIFSIIALYLSNFKAICGKEIANQERSSLNKFVFDLVNDFAFKEAASVKPDGFISMRIDQDPVTWFLIRDIVCPFAGTRFRNLRVVAGNAGHLDACKYITEKEIPHSNLSEENFPFIFMNLDIERNSIRSAFLFYEAVKAHCHNPSETIRAIFTDRSIGSKMIGFLTMANKDQDDTANFFAILSILCNSSDMENFAVRLKTGHTIQNLTKTGQMGSTNWWFLGLIEKMLDPARGPDWTVYKMWKPFIDDLHKRVEDERKKRGLDELPLELLLRVQGDEFMEDNNKTLQALLSKQRVW